jgi:threonine/homoserine/homoserine lactone efflux protein
LAFIRRFIRKTALRSRERVRIALAHESPTLAAIALGLSWVLENAGYLLDLMRWVGAACLIWIGVQACRNASGLGRAWFMRPARAKLLGRLSGLTLISGGVWLSLARRPA